MKKKAPTTQLGQERKEDTIKEDEKKKIFSSLTLGGLGLGFASSKRAPREEGEREREGVFNTGAGICCGLKWKK